MTSKDSLSMTERKTVIIGVLLVMVGPAALSLMTPVLPLIADAFQIQPTVVKFTMTGYMFGLVCGQVLSGTLSDALGRKSIALAFVAIFFVATLIGLFSTSIVTLILARVLQGLGAAAGWATTRAVVRDLFDGKPAARVMSNITMFLGITPAIVPIIGGLAGGLGGWHAVFVLMALASVGIFVALAISMEETNPASGREATSPLAILATYRDILGNIEFRRSASAMGGAVGIMYATLSIMPYIIIDQLRFSPELFGVLMMIQAIAAGTAAWINGRLVSRYSLVRLTKAGLLIPLITSIALGIYLVLFEVSATVIVAAGCAMAAGNALVMPNAATLAVSPFSRRAGAASSLVGLAQVGLGFVGSLIAAILPSAPLSLVLIPLVFAGCGFAIFRRMPETD